jgi:hypothetical protein
VGAGIHDGGAAEHSSIWKQASSAVIGLANTRWLVAIRTNAARLDQGRPTLVGLFRTASSQAAASRVALERVEHTGDVVERDRRDSHRRGGLHEGSRRVLTDAA